MPLQRKLGRATDQRKAMLKNLVTALFCNGRIETTEARAKEVRAIAEKLITIAVKETDNYESKSVKYSEAKKDTKGNKILVDAVSRNNKKYKKVEREIKTKMVRVDNPSRLNARKKIVNATFRFKDNEGANINVAKNILDEIAPKYKGRNGGYTRIYKIGPRRGDAAEMAIIELV